VTPGAKGLLWANGIVFLLTLLARPLIDWFALRPGAWVESFPLLPFWQVVTYGFLHSTGSAFHLLFNLLGIYFFGSMLEGIIGTRRFLAWYLAAVVVGGLAQLAAGIVSYLGGTDVGYTLGASGGVLFLIVACATLRPDTLVIFILFPLKLKTLALIMVGLDLFGLLSGTGGTAYLVHIAGAVLGFAAVKLRWVWVDPVERVQEHREASRERSAAEDAQKLDALLKQIHERGIGSLTKREREFLKRMSSRR
jgi:membrane associated rhomboid family serine protease